MQGAPDEGVQVRGARPGSLGSGANRCAAPAPWGMAGLATLGLVVPVVGLTLGQALLLPRRFGVPPEWALVDVTVAPSLGSLDDEVPLVEMEAFGDSAMAGVGVHHLDDFLPVQLAQRVADATGRPVHVVGYARSGARTRDVLNQQLPQVHHKPDVCVLVVGTNDVTGVTSPSRLARSSTALLDALESLGAPVVMSGLPRFRSMRSLPHPLMEVVSVYGRVVAAVQRRAVTTRPGVRLVDAAKVVGPEYFNDVATMSADAFHPSAAGYGRIADALVPAVVDALVAGTPTATSVPQRP